MPVMAHSPGALQLLPNHQYPQPWLHLCVRSRVNSNTETERDVVHLPTGNPYDLYRDMQSWYRLIDPKLADPANKHRGEFGARDAIRKVIERAEQFHRETLGAYYHPNTYAFYAADPDHQSFGSVIWKAYDVSGGAVYTEANLRSAVPVPDSDKSRRRVKVEGKTLLDFGPEPQDTAGDGTVPQQSGSGPQGKVR